jgi:hypothetical protein
MFDDYTQRRPMLGPDIDQPTYAPAPAPPSFGEMMAMAPKGGGGVNADSIGSLFKLGTAAAGRMGGGATKSKMVDSPVPQMKRPFQVGPPYETNA